MNGSDSKAVGNGGRRYNLDRIVVSRKARRQRDEAKAESILSQEPPKPAGGLRRMKTQSAPNEAISSRVRITKPFFNERGLSVCAPAYHGSFFSRWKKPPLGPSSGKVASATAVCAPSSTVRSPVGFMSVFTLPGWAEFTLIGEPRSTLARVNGESVHGRLARIVAERVSIRDDAFRIAVLGE